MTRRDIVALLAGAGIALASAAALLPAGRAAVGDALAQGNAQAGRDAATPADRRGYLMLALANALASVAVDGERTAVSLNRTVDNVDELEARLASLERRVAALEGGR
jgi:hypothetical protein